jgi:hypothetical protein
MASTNVYWLTAHVMKDNIKALTVPLLKVEDALKPIAFTLDVFVRNVEDCLMLRILKGMAW